VHQPRPDSQTHFDFADKSDVGENNKTSRPKSQQKDNSMGLYRDNVIENEPAATVGQETPKQPLTTMTNVDLAHRKKDFGSQFEIEDQSPAIQRTTNPVQEKKVDQNRAKVLKGMDSNWSMYDESPDGAKKENYRIKLGGNGMGGRKETEARHWGYEAEEEQPQQRITKPKAAAPPTSNKTGGSFWDF
jgi:hypothetical protein